MAKKKAARISYVHARVLGKKLYVARASPAQYERARKRHKVLRVPSGTQAALRSVKRALRRRKK